MLHTEEGVYRCDDCIVFRQTNALYGGLSNMAAGYPLRVNGHEIRTVEALYQACRFPHRPDLQRQILAEPSPMAAKMVAKPYRGDSRADWDEVRVIVMEWCLRVKLAQNWERFGELLLATGRRPIVEESRRDAFWGARRVDEGVLQGENRLGGLLMELRERLRGDEREALRCVGPLAVNAFQLLGELIGPVRGQE